MSSSGQATDLSMDEILASIRKIISEDPKPAVAVAQSRAPATDGMLTAANAARQHTHATTPVAPIHGRDPIQSGARTVKPTLDDDILDLLDEDKGPAVAVVQDARAAAKLEEAKSGQAQPTSRLGLNDMWTPREWSKPGAAAPDSAPAARISGIQAPTASVSEPTEARLEAAIAALGQSLATPEQADLPAKPIVVATAPKKPAQPGPRIDVVAVVNAATRAALAQKSADEQMALPVSAMPLAPLPAAAERPEPPITPVPQPPRLQEAEKAPPSSVAGAAAVRAPSPPVTGTAPAVAPAVNAAVEAALAAARAAPPRADTARSADVKPPATKAGNINGAGTPKVATATAAARPEPVIVKAAAASPTPVPVAESSKPASVAPPSPGTSTATAGANSADVGYLAPAAPLPAPPAGVQTLEDTVARLLRPMLRQWLDDNMPRIVEKAFKEELAAQAAPPPQAPRKAN